MSARGLPAAFGESAYQTTVKIDGVEYTALCVIGSPDPGLAAALHITRWVQDVCLYEKAERIMDRLSDDEWQSLFTQIEMELVQ